jgi:hypothetical protein
MSKITRAMVSRNEALLAESQKQLVDFLRAELEIGVTFVRSSLLARSQGHASHAIQAKRNAVKAARAIRRFTSRLKDGRVRIAIDRKLGGLERRISEL